MSRLDEVLKNGFVLDDTAEGAIYKVGDTKQAIKDLMLEIIGKNDKGGYEPADKYRANTRNKLRRELRQKVNEL